MKEINSRHEYISLVKDCVEKKKSILAVKTHLESGHPMNVEIKNGIAKCKKVDGSPIAELSLSKLFISNQLDADAEKADAELTAIDAAWNTFYVNNL